MPRLIDNTEHWRRRAAEARALAEKIADPTGRRMMLGAAEAYDALARDAERREPAAREGPIR